MISLFLQGTYGDIYNLNQNKFDEILDEKDAEIDEDMDDGQEIEELEDEDEVSTLVMSCL